MDSVAELGRQIEAGRIDPLELAETALARIDAHPLKERIFARVTADRARAEATAARGRARRGLRRSPVDGVPISWKDLFDTAGTATEAGSRLLSGRVPDGDAAVLRTATAAGLICLGKTHMSELAFSGLGLNPRTGTPPCINDPEAVAGGSSSGAAASVAFGLAAGAIGSDTGGSVRIPAAWNDLVGLKTTAGRLPMQGVVPLCPRFDTIGPLTRSLEDAALLFGALAGRHPVDLSGAQIAGRRLLVLETIALEGLEDGPAAGFEAALQALEEAGAILVPGSPSSVEPAMDLSATLFATEAYGVWRDRIEADPAAMFPPILARFRGGRDVSGHDYVAAWRELERLRIRYLADTADCDAVILPTCPIAPPRVGRLLDDADYFVERNLMTLRNTRIANLMGLPALTLPTGVPSAGLLVQVRPREEERLLRLGAAMEKALM